MNDRDTLIEMFARTGQSFKRLANGDLTTARSGNSYVAIYTLFSFTESGELNSVQTETN